VLHVGLNRGKKVESGSEGPEAEHDQAEKTLKAAGPRRQRKICLKLKYEATTHKKKKRKEKHA
jgi:hypothetical protein